MQRRELKILIYCLLMCIASGCAVYWMVYRQRKIAVIDTIKLFDGYNMKKELEGMAKSKLLAESKQIDSVGNLLKMSKAIDSNETEVKKLIYTYNYLKAKLDDDYKQSNHDINEQVWKRLNPLLDEYGKKKDFKLIIGANGMGTVLYMDNSYDVTNDVIEYINKKYAEGN